MNIEKCYEKSPYTTTFEPKLQQKYPVSSNNSRTRGCLKKYQKTTKHGRQMIQFVFGLFQKTTAELLEFLVITKNSKVILELGTSAGYSTIYLARGVKQTGGHIYTMETYKPKIEMAQKFFKQAQLTEYITQIEGDIHIEVKSGTESRLRFS